MTQEKLQPFEDVDIFANTNHSLVLYNDDFNTFDFVIETLIQVCGHTPEQAETCTWIVHYKGKCAVKSGDLSELKPIYNEFRNRNLTASID
ncbi:MAG TPA: ATP-dependent Clp protease adaptor ClpS [Bacteroidales bacterium]|nr:ATP-dependent Clp protease adaptor ClpS [Bacteroidales bacterium]